MIRPAKNKVLMRIVLKLSPAISYCMVLVYARQQQRQQPCSCSVAIGNVGVCAISEGIACAIRDCTVCAIGGEDLRSISNVAARSITGCRRVALGWDSARPQWERPLEIQICA